MPFLIYIAGFMDNQMFHKDDLFLATKLLTVLIFPIIAGIIVGAIIFMLTTPSVSGVTNTSYQYCPND